MKIKCLFIAALMAVLMPAVADDNVTVAEFTLAAGDEQMVDIIVNNERDYLGVQFNLQLPQGVTIVEDEDGLFYEPTDRLSYAVGRNTKQFDYSVTGSDGSYIVLVANTDNAPFQGNSGDPIMRIKVTASDQISTGIQQCVLTDIKMPTSGVASEGTNIPELTSDCTLLVNAPTAASGYGTFSWPRALDFSDTDVQVFVADSKQDLVVNLTPVTKVPANTGVVLIGSPSAKYNPTTIDDADAGTVSSILVPTSDAAYNVATDDVYALATKSRGTAFYKVSQGVNIPQYKAYLNHTPTTSASEDVVTFDTNGVSDVVQDGNAGQWYSTAGYRVPAPNGNGIFICDGKKFFFNIK